MGYGCGMRNRCIFFDAATHASIWRETDYGFQFQLRSGALPDDRLGGGMARDGVACASTARGYIWRSPRCRNGGGAFFFSWTPPGQGASPLYQSYIRPWWRARRTI